MMFCEKCGAELIEDAKFCHNCGAAVSQYGGVRTRQDIGTVKGDVVGTVVSRDAEMAGGDVSTTQRVDSVEAGGTLVGTVLGEEDSPVYVGGQQHYGEFVHGDKIEGDKISVDDVTGSTGVAIGRGAQASVTQGVSGDDIVDPFAAVYQQIYRRPEDPDVAKDELTAVVQKIEDEATKGEGANPNKMERWLKMLALMARDVFDVTVASLTSPTVEIASVIRKVAEKARAEVEGHD